MNNFCILLNLLKLHIKRIEYNRVYESLMAQCYVSMVRLLVGTELSTVYNLIGSLVCFFHP